MFTLSLVSREGLFTVVIGDTDKVLCLLKKSNCSKSGQGCMIKF